jgi:hypothetical protein
MKRPLCGNVFIYRYFLSKMFIYLGMIFYIKYFWNSVLLYCSVSLGYQATGLGAGLRPTGIIAIGPDGELGSHIFPLFGQFGETKNFLKRDLYCSFI